MLALSLEELVTPVAEALVAVGRLLIVSSGEILRVSWKLEFNMNYFISSLTLIHSTNRSLFFLRRRNCPRTT